MNLIINYSFSSQFKKKNPSSNLTRLPRRIITFVSLLHILLKETSVRERDIIALLNYWFLNKHVVSENTNDKS